MSDSFDHEAKDCPCRIDVSAATSPELEWQHGDCKRHPDGYPRDTLGEILATLKSIDAKLSPPLTKKGKHVKLGRIFSAGQTIPDDVDLVTGASNLRWKRAYNDMRVPLDQWYPRDGDGPVVSGNVLIAQNGHVTEIPAPGSEAGT